MTVFSLWLHQHLQATVKMALTSCAAMSMIWIMASNGLGWG